jgi:outer membrane lipopolysaccharide assembly protein LptE/RlpB
MPHRVHLRQPEGAPQRTLAAPGLKAQLKQTFRLFIKRKLREAGVRVMAVVDAAVFIKSGTAQGHDARPLAG